MNMYRFESAFGAGSRVEKYEYYSAASTAGCRCRLQHSDPARLETLWWRHTQGETLSRVWVWVCQ